MTKIEAFETPPNPNKDIPRLNRIYGADCPVPFRLDWRPPIELSLADKTRLYFKTYTEYSTFIRNICERYKKLHPEEYAG